MNNSKVVVRQATVEDEEKLLDFYKRVWPDRYKYKYPERFNWISNQNPELGKFDGLPIWIALIDDEIVGHTSAIMVHSIFFSSTILAGMSIDTIVNIKARGLGIGKKLQNINQESHKVFMALSDIAPINFNVKKKIGGTEGPLTNVYCFVNLLNFQNSIKPLLNRVSILRNVKNNSFLGKIIHKSLAIKFEKRVKTVNNSDLNFIKINKFNFVTDRIWKESRRQYDFCVERYSAYMNWKYCSQPYTEYKKYIITNNEKNIGVLIYRLGTKPEPNVGIIAELYFTNDSKKFLIQSLIFAITEMKKDNVEMIHYASADTKMHKSILSIGFKLIRQQYPIIHIKNQTDIVQKINTAHISRGEQDWDQFPLANVVSLKNLL